MVWWSALEVPPIRAGRTGRTMPPFGWRGRTAAVPPAGAGAKRPRRGRIGGLMTPLDRLGRPLHDLRISVTDRCNFRCTYCMPKEVFGRDYAFLPRDQVLSFEEIERAARAFVALGVEKLRLTGGEPLV